MNESQAEFLKEELDKLKDKVAELRRRLWPGSKGKGNTVFKRKNGCAQFLG